MVAAGVPSPESVVTVGLISDTHGLLRPQALHALAGVHRIVHAGDVGCAGILQRLGELAPVTAVRGNNDLDDWALPLPLIATLDLGALRLQVVHELPHLQGVERPEGTRVVVHGHSHRPVVERRGGVLYVNPGSAGPRRFRLPVSLALLRVRGAEVEAEIVPLL